MTGDPGLTTAVVERAAEAVHRAWMAEKVRQGTPAHTLEACPVWAKDGDCPNPKPSAHHFDMVPWAELPEDAKEVNRVTARAVLAAVQTRVEAARSSDWAEARAATLQTALMIAIGYINQDTDRLSVEERDERRDVLVDLAKALSPDAAMCPDCNVIHPSMPDCPVDGRWDCAGCGDKNVERNRGDGHTIEGSVPDNCGPLEWVGTALTATEQELSDADE